MEKTKYLDRSEFKLEKFKMDKDEMLVAFQEQRQTNEGLVKIPVTMAPPFKPHPDLTDLLARLKVYVLKQYDYHKLFLARDKDKEKSKEMRAAWEELQNNLTVSGFTFTGSEQLRGAIITAKLKTETGTRALPTGRIVFSSDKQGYEKEIEVICDEVENEVYACLYENKRAQLNLFQEEPKKDAELGLVS